MSKQTKPITIITTIQPPDGKGKRKLTVAAAPDGEMPVTLAGLFADWHTLEAEAYVAVSTRKPQVVKVKAASAGKQKGTASKGKDESDADEKPDQLVQPEEGGTLLDVDVEPTPDVLKITVSEHDSSTEPVPDDEEQLPLIEGDN